MIARPGEPGYAAATRVFNLSAPAEPEAAVTARSIEDIRAALDHAAGRGLPVRIHTTGHGAAAARPVRGGLLIRTELDGAVEVDPVRRLARIPAGTRWGQVVSACKPYGLVPPHGSSRDVGCVGYLLRGGLSFYGRKVGLATNSVRAVELVGADGDLRRADAETDPELLWALRGGGGGFGVVTAVEVELFPVSRVITGAAFWPIEHAERLLHAWYAWTLDAPWEASTSARVFNLPALPEVPPVLAAGPVLCVDGAIMADDLDTARRQAEDLLGPLRAIAEPVMDTWAQTDPIGVLDAHMDPADPVAIVGDHMLLGELGTAGIEALTNAIARRTPLVTAGLRQLGGAFARPAPGGVLNHLDAPLAYSGAGVPEGSSAEQIRECCAAVREALAPWDTGRTAPTFVESAEQPQGHLTAAEIEAVDAVRLRVDPGGVFRGDIAPGCSNLI